MLLAQHTPGSTGIPKRERALLAIEREYWLSQTHEWLLITPEVYDPLIGLAVKYNSGWAVGSAPKSDDLCEEGARLVKCKYSLNLTQSYALLAAELQCCHEEAQAIFWQAVWRGYGCAWWDVRAKCTMVSSA